MSDEPRCPGAWDKGGCGRITIRIRGHVCLCLRCTEKEIGMTVGDLRERVTNMMLTGRKRKWSVHSTGARERGVKSDQRKRRA